MNIKPFYLLSTFSLLLLLSVGCTHETDEFAPEVEDFPVPQIITRTETSLTTSSFIGLDANQDLTFCYAAEREDAENSSWEWSDPNVTHSKNPDGKELSQLAIVMPQIDTNARVYRITQEDLGNFYSFSGILWGAAGCPGGNPPSSFEAKQQLAKLFIESDESLLEYASSFTLYLAPSANLDFATGMSLTSPSEVKAFTYTWKPGQKSFSTPIFPQVFEKGATIMEYKWNGETRCIKMQSTVSVGPNQALMIKLSKSALSLQVGITDWINNEEVEDDATIHK